MDHTQLRQVRHSGCRLRGETALGECRAQHHQYLQCITPRPHGLQEHIQILGRGAILHALQIQVQDPTITRRLRVQMEPGAPAVNPSGSLLDLAPELIAIGTGTPGCHNRACNSATRDHSNQRETDQLGSPTQRRVDGRARRRTQDKKSPRVQRRKEEGIQQGERRSQGVGQNKLNREPTSSCDLQHDVAKIRDELHCHGQLPVADHSSKHDAHHLRSDHNHLTNKDIHALVSVSTRSGSQPGPALKDDIRASQNGLHLPKVGTLDAARLLDLKHGQDQKMKPLFGPATEVHLRNITVCGCQRRGHDLRKNLPVAKLQLLIVSPLARRLDDQQQGCKSSTRVSK
mmetsp:Transcript_60322/g.161878  ORF Transcript_60322/g.161878 Transcript_60322/m.161878 type:complete len:344 (+) Transcript_60322:1042-2073(+)